MDKGLLKSDYCMITATKAFEELIERADTSISYFHIIICLTRNDRSNAENIR